MKYDNPKTKDLQSQSKFCTLFSSDLEQPSEWKTMTMAARSCAAFLRTNLLRRRRPSQPLRDDGSTSTNTDASTELLDLALLAGHLLASSHREQSAAGPARARPLRAQLGRHLRRPAPRGPLADRDRSRRRRENRASRFSPPREPEPRPDSGRSEVSTFSARGVL
jgi:hypothetical protein